CCSARLSNSDQLLSKSGSRSVAFGSRREVAGFLAMSPLYLEREVLRWKLRQKQSARLVASSSLSPYKVTFPQSPVRARRRPIRWPSWKSTDHGRTENRFRSRSEILWPDSIRATTHPKPASIAGI